MLSLSLSLSHTHTHTHIYIYIYITCTDYPSLCSLCLPASAWLPPPSPRFYLIKRHAIEPGFLPNISARSMGDVHPARVISRPAAEARPPSAAIAEPIRSVNWLTVVQFSFPAPLSPEIGISRHKTRSNRKEKKPEEGVSCVCVQSDDNKQLCRTIFDGGLIGVARWARHFTISWRLPGTQHHHHSSLKLNLSVWLSQKGTSKI